MHLHQPNLDTQWLRDFSAALVRGTHRSIDKLSVHLECDRVVIRGRARSYYAVQLAIHAIRKFNEKRSRFSETLLQLCIHDRQLELTLIHAVEIESNLRVDVRPRKSDRELLSTSS